MAIGFIRYEDKASGQYATLYKAKRVNGIKKNETTNLGRVIDKEKGVFRNRERGEFVFDDIVQTVQHGSIKQIRPGLA
jgi:hypothetical protein